MYYTLNVVLAKVTYWDEIESKMSKQVHVFTAYNFQDAARQLEDYYGDTIEKVHIQLYDEGLPTLPTNLYKKLDGWLSGREAFER